MGGGVAGEISSKSSINDLLAICEDRLISFPISQIDYEEFN